MQDALTCEYMAPLHQQRPLPEQERAPPPWTGCTLSCSAHATLSLSLRTGRTLRTFALYARARSLSLSLYAPGALYAHAHSPHMIPTPLWLGLGLGLANPNPHHTHHTHSTRGPPLLTLPSTPGRRAASPSTSRSPTSRRRRCASSSTPRCSTSTPTVAVRTRSSLHSKQTVAVSYAVSTKLTQDSSQREPLSPYGL